MKINVREYILNLYINNWTLLQNTYLSCSNMCNKLILNVKWKAKIESLLLYLKLFLNDEENELSFLSLLKCNVIFLHVVINLTLKVSFTGVYLGNELIFNEGLGSRLFSSLFSVIHFGKKYDIFIKSYCSKCDVYKTTWRLLF